MTPALTPAQARILKAMQEGAIVRAFKNEIGAVAILQTQSGFDGVCATCERYATH